MMTMVIVDDSFKQKAFGIKITSKIPILSFVYITVLSGYFTNMITNVLSIFVLIKKLKNQNIIHFNFTDED